MNPHSLDAILACRVLHFFDSAALMQSARQMFSWLARDGKAFIVGESVYVGTMRAFVPEYERRLAAGDPWPGWFDDVHAR